MKISGRNLCLPAMTIPKHAVHNPRYRELLCGHFDCADADLYISRKGRVVVRTEESVGCAVVVNDEDEFWDLLAELHDKCQA